MSCWVNLVSCNSDIHLLILLTNLSETVVEWIQYDVNTVFLLTNLAGAHMWDIPDSTCGKLRLSPTPPNEEVVVWKRILFNWLDMSRRCKVRTPRHRAALARWGGEGGVAFNKLGLQAYDFKTDNRCLIIDVGDMSTDIRMSDIHASASWCHN